MLPYTDINSPYYYQQAPTGDAPIEPQYKGMTFSLVDPGNYQGGIKDDKRHGVGECTWSDESRYNGDWVDNVRHGNGLFITGDGIKFEGQWVNDVKHGMGILTYSDGQVIEGFWLNDRINGLCKVKQKGEKDFQQVIFKDDMMIMSNNSGVSCCDKFYIICSVLMMLTVYAGIPLGIIVGP